MKRAVKTLLKPDLRVVYLNNAVSEKVEYLDIDPELSIKSLKADVAGGASHFKEVVSLVEKERTSRFIVVTADNKENGLMAVSYLAACMDNAPGEIDLDDYEEYLKHEKNPFGETAPFDFDEDYGSVWTESSRKVPVLDVGEIKSYLCNHNESFDLGGYRVQQRNAYGSVKPYWTNCKKESVCIICDKYQADSLNSSVLELFRSNRHVYLLFVERNADEFFTLSLPFEMDVAVFDNIKNNIILAYTADEIHVTMQDVDMKSYYTNVMKQNFKRRGVRVQKNFSYVRVVNVALSLRKEAVCSTLNLIVNYAVKDKEQGASMILTNKDFDFVDRFMRTENKKTEEKASYRIQSELVGMEEIKEQVADIVNVMKYNKLRANLNIKGSTYHNVHVMLGAPGTAKTTVAQLMGQIMVEERLLPDNRFICVNGAELKGQYVGQSAPKTKALFDNYDVIIIDEAYSLTEGNGSLDSFSTESIAQLIIELEKHSTDKLIIFAGYGGRDIDKKDNKMDAFLDANPGIKSRITSTFYFKSYTPDEMVEIFKRIAHLANYRVDGSADKILKDFFEKRVRDTDFGNGREARNLLETSIVFAARRLMADKKEKYTAEELKYLTLSDVQKAVVKLSDSFGIRNASEKYRIGF